MAEKQARTEQSVYRAIADACDRRLGVLDHKFLCQSIGVMNPPVPYCVRPEMTLGEVVKAFKDESIGSVLITAPDRTLKGIFTERDCVRRALPDYDSNRNKPISEFMTADPVSQPPDITIAFALNLMSEGGFRHLPLVDDHQIPIGILSVRDMMDFIVRTFVEELLKFDTEGAVGSVME